MMPDDLPPWAAVYQQRQRWLKAGVFETSVDDLRAILRLAQGRNEEPSAAIFDSRTLQSSPRSAAIEQVMTEPNDAKAAKSIWLLIRVSIPAFAARHASQ